MDSKASNVAAHTPMMQRLDFPMKTSRRSGRPTLKPILSATSRAWST